MRTFIIHNPAASRAGNLSTFIERKSTENHFQWCQSGTTSANCPSALALKAIADDFDRIVIVGGDGTVNDVVNAIAPEFPVELAIVPCGTGNDLARSAGIPIESIESAFSIALQNQCRAVDVIQIEANGKTTYCLNAINGGLGGCVAEDVKPESKKQWGNLAYWFTAISLFGNLPRFQTVLELDDEVIELDSTGIAVANGRYVGGGFPIAPEACLDDGLLDVSVAPMLPTVELMAAGLNFVLSRHEREDRIKMFRARKVHVRSNPPMPFSVDGEPVRSFDASFTVLPSAAKLVVGDKAIAIGKK